MNIQPAPQPRTPDTMLLDIITHATRARIDYVTSRLARR